MAIHQRTTWQRVMVACVVLVMLHPWGSLDASSQDVPGTPIQDEPAPTVPAVPTVPPVTMEPTNSSAEPTPVPTETASIPTEIPSTESPASPDVHPTEVPSEPATSPITDSLNVIEGGGAVELASGHSHTVRVSYLVTTERQATDFRIWLDGDVLNGWQLAVDHPNAVSTDAGTASMHETAATSMGSIIEVAVTVTAPAGELSLVALHVSSSVVLPDGSEQPGVDGSVPLATFSVLPASDDETVDRPISPLVVSNNGMTCTQVAPHVVRPGASISFGCQGVNGGTYRISATTSGWLVSIGNGTPASTVTTTLGSADDSKFVVNIHAPSGAAQGATGTIQVARTDVTGATSTITVSVVAITNDTGSLLNRMTCANPQPTSLVVAPGGRLTFRCSIEGLAGLKLLGISVLNLDLTASSLPASWTLGSSLSGTGTGAVNVDIASNTTLDLLIANGITFTVDVPCVTQSGTVTVKSFFNISAIARVEQTSSIPLTIDTSQVVSPTVMASGVAAFPAVTWNGTSYPTSTTRLTITFGTPTTGCMGNWQLLVSGTDLTRSGGGGSIPVGWLSYTGATASTDITARNGPIAIGASPASIATGTNAVTSGSTLNLNLVLAPPVDTPVGTYGGQLTFTTALGPT